MAIRISHQLRQPRTVFGCIVIFIMIASAYKSLAEDLVTVENFDQYGAHKNEEVYLRPQAMKFTTNTQPTQLSVNNAGNIMCTPVEKEKYLDERIVDTNRLSDMLKTVSINKRIIVSFASNSQRVLLRNFMCSVKRRHTNWIIIPFDEVTHNDVTRIFGAEHSFFDSKMLGDELVADWDRDGDNQEYVWRDLMHVKVNAVRAILRLGYDVFIADADTSVVRNIAKYASLNDQCDMKFQADSKLALTYEGYRGEKKFNCGVYFVKKSPQVLRLYDVWADQFNCLEGFREQRALHLTLQTLQEHQDYYVYDPRTDTPFYGEKAVDENNVNITIPEISEADRKALAAANTGIKMCYLNPADFPNGGLYFGQNKPFRAMYGAKAPVMLHTNYMKSKLERKINAFEVVGAWFLDSTLQCTVRAQKPLSKPLTAKELFERVDD
ncbi:hypothetical protein SARC_04601 [Sphaeroforma arctica JP610]|uniref:Nucleotide-diphospho-sugar transferase domain-containing protein n=1 Tax=Sphaeroforma arctica JP610 TaxID=667725 RepID=A0A0L0G2Q5_9EUKA|nr:hypothetical protein SARC_04601 [Sphaeroforma arctica JP610]KNC83129.1 hypothetical protein SARC_04601 [Sphaeroforma arctica JP610]|eukprot:XP_014157031.1 hypothetical protein SARC_04601 [Sphaeroforma arctica JP610]